MSSVDRMLEDRGSLIDDGWLLLVCDWVALLLMVCDWWMICDWLDVVQLGSSSDDVSFSLSLWLYTNVGRLPGAISIVLVYLSH